MYEFTNDTEYGDVASYRVAFSRAEDQAGQLQCNTATGMRRAVWRTTRGPSSRKTASWSVRRALLTLQVQNRRTHSTTRNLRAAWGHGRRKWGWNPP